MKLGLKEMKKEYKKVDIDEIEVWWSQSFVSSSWYCFLPNGKNCYSYFKIF